VDSLLLKNYEQKILENSKLKTDLQTERQKNLDLSNAYKKDTLALQKQIKDLKNEISVEKQKVSDLNKNKIKEEKEKLQTKADSLNGEILKLNQTIADKDRQIATSRQQGDQKARTEKENGKKEALASLINSYKNKMFDDLIKSSNKESVRRDMQLIGNNAEVNPILTDLQIYFNAEELLLKKIDAAQIKNAQTQLSQIKRQSKRLDALKENIEYYQDFNTALKETIGKLVSLDNRNSAAGDSEIQKRKFNDIVTILADYMYNYYDYTKYKYLSDIVFEIIKRKKPSADADISDLLNKL
jgi:chromosome segregation ATPase